MAKVRFSRRAEADFDDITGYTVRTWDADQAHLYLTLLDNYYSLLLLGALHRLDALLSTDIRLETLGELAQNSKFGQK